MWAPNTRPSTSPIGSVGTGSASTLKSRALPQQCASPFLAWGMRRGADTTMMVEGCRTGEERPLQPRDRPPPVAAVRAVSSAPPVAPTAATTSAPREAMKLRRLQQEVQRLKEENTRSDTERVELLQRLEAVGDAHKTAVSRIAALEVDVKEKEEYVQRVDKANSDLAQRLALTAEAGDASTRRVQNEISKLRSELAEARSTIASAEKENRTLCDRLHSAEMRHAADVNNLDTLSIEVRKLQSAAAETSRRENEAKRQSDAALQASAKREEALQQSVATLEDKLRNWQTSVEEIHRFIVSICRPQFPVVKDESLAAITSTTDSEGYVLVPLELMLGGYRLLPDEHRKGIAEEHKRRVGNS